MKEFEYVVVVYFDFSEINLIWCAGDLNYAGMILSQLIDTLPTSPHLLCLLSSGDVILYMIGEIPKNQDDVSILTQNLEAANEEVSQGIIYLGLL